MAENRRHIYRSPNALLGGVCAGVAQRFDMDVALTRILAVVLGILTLGLFVFVYLAAWLVLPNVPERDNTYEVNPDSFHSEIYEQVVVEGSAAKEGAARTPDANIPPVASIPPKPPAAASGYYAARSANTASPFAEAASPRAATPPVQPAAPALSPALAGGILLIAFGILALLVSLGFYTLDPSIWVRRAGPLLLVAVGLFIMGRASKSNILIVVSAIVLALFVTVGVISSIQENSFELGVSLSFSPDSLAEDSLAEQGESSAEA